MFEGVNDSWSEISLDTESMFEDSDSDVSVNENSLFEDSDSDASVDENSLFEDDSSDGDDLLEELAKGSDRNSDSFNSDYMLEDLFNDSDESVNDSSMFENSSDESFYGEVDYSVDSD